MSDELSKEIIKCFQRVFSFMFKGDFESREAGANPGAAHCSFENLAGYLRFFFFFSFNSLIPNVDKNKTNTTQDNL